MGDRSPLTPGFPPPVLALLGLAVGLGCCLGLGPRAGWSGVTGLLVGAGLVLLSAGSLVLGLRRALSSSLRRRQGWERAALVVERLMGREHLREEGTDERPYDPTTGEGVGRFLVEPLDLDRELVGGEEGVRYLVGSFRSEADPRRQRLLDRVLLYLEVDARTGKPIEEEPLIALRLQRRRDQELGGEHILPPWEPPHLVVGAVLLLGMVAACILVALQQAPWVVLLVALATGFLAAFLMVDPEGV